MHDPVSRRGFRSIPRAFCSVPRRKGSCFGLVTLVYFPSPPAPVMGFARFYAFVAQAWAWSVHVQTRSPGGAPAPAQPVG
jgi:hypothetical protein